MKKVLLLVVFVLGLVITLHLFTNNTGKGGIKVLEDSNFSENSLFTGNDLFSNRDLDQNPDLNDAKYYTVSDGKDITIDTGGVYVLQGTAKDMTVYVETSKDNKVQIILDGLNITNSDFPCIYVKQADKVFITTTKSKNVLEVTGEFVKNGETKTNGVIFSKDDITLNGIGTLTVRSTEKGIVGKDDLKITGGTYYITSERNAIEANDSIRISDGIFVLDSGTDGLHAENNSDDRAGYIYIGGGDFRIKAFDDAIHGNSIVEIDDGKIDIEKSGEGIEGTFVQINGGNINIRATNDGINASSKSKSYQVALEINGGYLKIETGAGDNDGLDSNGNIYINGGVVDINARCPVDYNGNIVYKGGTLIIGGEKYDYLPNQIIGGRDNRNERMKG